MFNPTEVTREKSGGLRLAPFGDRAVSKTIQMKDQTIMDKQRLSVNHELSMLAEHARALMTATADVCGDEVADARQRLAASLDHGKEVYGRAREKTLDGVKAADHAIRDHPYEAAILALGVGAVIGFLAGR